ncbi:MAG TPA: alkaline phosphatase family protein [Candidatus Baltobacteraceae bacterium]|jgi:phospholipase C|nr:alkaline phosphatase family protein [Candidatus Baltobacteraceae bacterium]
MSLKHVASTAATCLRIGLVSIALFQFTLGASMTSAAPPAPQDASNDAKTVTPIKHVIVIIGENRSFDHVFATYVPKDGQHVWNLLSEGIVNPDGTPGPNFYRVEQKAATDQTPDAFLLDPPKTGFPKGVLPAPLVGGPDQAASYIPSSNPLTGAPYTSKQLQSFAAETENGLPASYSPLILTGGSLAPSKTPDTRITNVNSLPPGPFQLTGDTFSYDDYAASPVHRFYQMWQQLDCSLAHASWQNPSGCDAALFPWVEVTVGTGGNGLPPASNFSTEYSPSAKTTGEGSTSMAFYNVQKGDVPYFKMLADTYAMSDNFHQSVDGGTGANHIMFGHADAIYFYDPNSATPYTPPNNATPGQLNEVENPNPLASTNNWYAEDGYGGGSYGSPAYGGGSYSECADPTQPGVSTIESYLKAVHVEPRCQPGHYYLLNNYNPGYFGQGEDAYTDGSPLNTIFTIPPSSTPSIGDDMIANHISWKYYGDQWDEYAGLGTSAQPPCQPGATTNCYIPEDKYQVNYGPIGSANELGSAIIEYPDEYCNICNPFQYDTSIMANPTVRQQHIQDTTNLYSDIANGTLPAVSIVKPSGIVDGHPASSKLDLFEGFTKKIVDLIEGSQLYAGDTAIFITEDEGGGYYDSGYVQPLDFFGDGTRIIFLVVSPFSKGGHIDHSYADHVSIDKFIERNWNLPPITSRSRDNFPDPLTTWSNPYVPINGPAISDLFELFDFGPTWGSGGGFGH